MKHSISNFQTIQKNMYIRVYIYIYTQRENKILTIGESRGYRWSWYYYFRFSICLTFFQEKRKIEMFLKTKFHECRPETFLYTGIMPGLWKELYIINERRKDTGKEGKKGRRERGRKEGKLTSETAKSQR